jgi:hypothetical protein
MAHGVIYGLHDPLTGELRYIGQTVKAVPERLASHVCPSSLKRHSYLARWLGGLVKRGLSPTWSQLAEAQDQSELDRLEVEFIARARIEGIRLVNQSDGGGGRAGFKLSAETKEKLRVANTGKPHGPHTPEWKAHMAQVMAGRQTNTPEHMARLAEAKRGKPRSEETKARISAAKKGTPSPKKGIPMSEEQKAKVSASRKGKMTEASHHQYRGDISTEAILKRLSEGATKVEIAQELGVSSTFVHRRVGQARRTLGEDAFRSYKRRKNSPVPASM